MCKEPCHLNQLLLCDKKLLLSKENFRFTFLPPANEVWDKVMFYICLPFCPGRGWVGGGNMQGMGCAWQETCMAREHVWWRGGYVWQGDMLGRGNAWQGSVCGSEDVHDKKCWLVSGWYASYWNAVFMKVTILHLGVSEYTLDLVVHFRFSYLILDL